MFDDSIQRVGFCCKWIDDESQINGIPEGADSRALSTRGTTVAWLNRQRGTHAEAKLWACMEHNIESVRLLVERVGGLDPMRRMVRLGSDLLPLYTEPTWGWWWRSPGVRKYCETHFAEIGRLARELDVRLSFHPGEFTVLASDRLEVVERSIDEMEYHGDMIRWMGYGVEFQDIKCNVHISGRQGADGIIRALRHMSPEVRNTISIENSEMNWGIDESFKLIDHCALVLDIHHHWVKTGEHIYPDDPRILYFMESWRDVRPVIHYSQPRLDRMPDHDPHVMFDYDALIASGHNRTSLRAHSDFYWNEAANEWASSFLPWFDIQTESKAKNLSRDLFVQSVVSRNLVTL